MNKQDYKKSPALNFLSAAEHDQDQTQTQGGTQSEDRTPEGMRLNPDYIEKYIEKRTKRVQIVVQPSLYDKAKAKADSLNKSFNDYVHGLLEADNK